MTGLRTLRTRAALLGGTALIAALAATPASAQAAAETPASAATTATDDGGITDIVVTATRREERLQDVPISVTAIGGPALTNAGVLETRNLTNVVPGLVFSRTGTQFQPTIRGVGTRSGTAGDESNIAFYVDGIYQFDMTSLNLELLETERVEVLRGPQGTLFGRNATGGLINVITPLPSFDTKVSGEMRFGRFQEMAARSYITGGLTPTLAADLALGIYGDGGYVRDLTLGGKRNTSKESFAARSKLRWQPNDDAQIVLTGQYQRTDDPNIIAHRPLNGNTAQASVPGTLIANENWTVAQDVGRFAISRGWAVTLQSRFDLGGPTLETTGSYHKGYYKISFDSDYTPNKTSAPLNTTKTNDFSQEIRLLSDSAGRFRWIAGAFAFYARSRYDPLDTIGYALPGAPVISRRLSNNVTRSYAGFAEGTYDVTDKLSLVAGLRYTYEKRRYRTVLDGVQQVKARTSFDEWTWRGTAQYKFSEDANAYATYSRGFKSGIFNLTVSLPTATDPEVLDAWEVGIKTDPTRWLRINADVFYYDYKGLQLGARNDLGQSTLQNAASTHNKGAEVEAVVALGRELNLRGNIAYLDAEYKSFPNAQITIPIVGGGNVQNFTDVSGNDVPRAPGFTFTVGGSYEKEFDSGTLFANANLYHSSKYYWDPYNRLVQPAYEMLSAELGWAFGSEGQFRASVWGQNLTNSAVALVIGTSPGGDYIAHDRPRTYGIKLGARF